MSVKKVEQGSSVTRQDLEVGHGIQNPMRRDSFSTNNTTGPCGEGPKINQSVTARKAVINKELRKIYKNLEGLEKRLSMMLASLPKATPVNLEQKRADLEDIRNELASYERLIHKFKSGNLNQEQGYFIGSIESRMNDTIQLFDAINLQIEELQADIN